VPCVFVVLPRKVGQRETPSKGEQGPRAREAMNLMSGGEGAQSAAFDSHRIGGFAVAPSMFDSSRAAAVLRQSVLSEVRGEPLVLGCYDGRSRTAPLLPLWRYAAAGGSRLSHGGLIPMR